MLLPMVSTIFSKPCDLSMTVSSISTWIVSMTVVLREQTTVQIYLILPFFSKSYITIFRNL